MAQSSPAVQEELGYVRQHSSLIGLLLQVQQVVDSFSRLVKSQGIHGATQAYWQKRRQVLETHWQEQGLAVGQELLGLLAGLEEYLREYLPYVGQESQLLCCSDVVETGLAHQYVWQVQVWL